MFFFFPLIMIQNTRETAQAIKGKTLKRAIKYLENVLEHKEAIPFRRYTGNIGRHAQAHMHKNCVQVGWPKKSVEFLLGLLQNAKASAENKGLDLDALTITHTQVQRAQKQRRRTYRAHGRINPYMSSPCHIELILEETEAPVPRPADDASTKKKPSKKKQARERAQAAAQS